MTLARLARMCDILEFQTPTEKVEIISNSMSSFSCKETLINILSMEYPTNNIGKKRAIKWIASSMGLFEDEVESHISIWGDVGEGVYQLDDDNEIDSEITLKQMLALLKMDCSSMGGNSYTLFDEHLNMMSAREKKWFLRYWIQKPRNGVNNKVPLKAMKKHYTDNKIEKYYQYNTATQICGSLEAGDEPECILKHGQFVNPMLAKARKGKEKPTNYIVDIKYDGNRYQIHKEIESVIIFNRKGKVVTDQYPDVVDIVKEFEVNNIILDTEIYPVNPDGSPAPHKILGKRVHSKDKAKAVRECPVKMVAFDCLSIQEVPIIESNLRTRLTHLSYIPHEYRAETFDDHTIQSAYNIAIDRGFEGIMIKDGDMTYQPGKRSKGWLKYKPPRFNFDVVITSAKYGEGKRANVFGTYGISVKDGSDFVSVGKVGTGFSDNQLSLLTRELRKHIESHERDTYYMLPRIVLEVTCDLVTEDAEGNVGLRFPRCIRIRDDKYVADADTIQRVMEFM
jgi:DNA ligase-1